MFTVERTTILRLCRSKRRREMMREHVLCSGSAFDFYLESLTPNVSVVRLFKGDNLVGWSCLDKTSNFSGLPKTATVGWYVVPEFRSQGLISLLAKEILPKDKRPNQTVLTDGQDWKRPKLHKVMADNGYYLAKKGWLDHWRYGGSIANVE